MVLFNKQTTLFTDNITNITSLLNTVAQLSSGAASISVHFDNASSIRSGADLSELSLGTSAMNIKT